MMGIQQGITQLRITISNYGILIQIKYVNKILTYVKLESKLIWHFISETKILKSISEMNDTECTKIIVAQCISTIQKCVAGP